MFLNGFSVRVVGGKELAGGYVEMDHGAIYKLQLRNTHDRRCDVLIDIDGKRVGGWRIEPHEIAVLERPINERGMFTFYRVDSVEGDQIGLDSVPVNDRGLVQVTFNLEEIKRTPVPRALKEHNIGYPMSSRGNKISADPYLMKSSKRTTKGAGGASAGGTGMSDDSRGILGSDAMDLMEQDSGRHRLFNMSASFESHEAGATGLSGHSQQEFREVSPLWKYDESMKTVISLRLIAKKHVRPLQDLFSNPIPSLHR